MESGGRWWKVVVDDGGKWWKVVVVVEGGGGAGHQELQKLGRTLGRRTMVRACHPCFCNPPLRGVSQRGVSRSMFFFDFGGLLGPRLCQNLTQKTSF